MSRKNTQATRMNSSVLREFGITPEMQEQSTPAQEATKMSTNNSTKYLGLVKVWSRKEGVGSYFPKLLPYQDFPELTLWSQDLEGLPPCGSDEKTILTYLEKVDASFGVIDGGKGGKLKYVTGIPKTWLKENYDLLGSGKIFKRLLALLRVYFVAAHYQDDEFKVYEYSCGEEETPHDYDGCGTMTESKYHQILDSMEVETDPIYLQKDLETLAKRHPEMDKEKLVELAIKKRTASFQRALKKAKKAKALNARIFGPGIGFKGQIFIIPDEYLNIDGIQYDMGTHPINFKPELKGKPGCGWHIGMEAQLPNQKCTTNVQFLINHPWLFPEDELREWLNTEISSLGRKICQNKLIEHSEDLLMEREEDPDSHYLKTRWAMSELSENGHDIRSYPSLCEMAFRGLTERFARFKYGKGEKWCKTIKIPIPNSYKEQIISEALAKRMGFNVEIHDDVLYRWTKQQVSVVSSHQWNNKFPHNHGGPDMDDFYVLLLIKDTKDGRLKVVVLRNPNDIDEISILYLLSDQEEILPAREMEIPETVEKRSENLDRIEVIEPEKPKANMNQEYSCFTLVDGYTNWKQGAHPGSYINIKMWYNMALGKQFSKLLTMEAAVDGTTQSICAEGLKTIEEYTEKLRSTLTKGTEWWNKYGFPTVEGKLRMDRHYFWSRGLYFKGFYKHLKLMDDRYSRISQMVIDTIEEAKHKLRVYLQGWIRRDKTRIPEPFRTMEGYVVDRDLRQIIYDLRKAYRNPDVDLDAFHQEVAEKVIPELPNGYESFGRAVYALPLWSKIELEINPGEGKKQYPIISEGLFWNQAHVDSILDLILAHPPKKEEEESWEGEKHDISSSEEMKPSNDLLPMIRKMIQECLNCAELSACSTEIKNYGDQLTEEQRKEVRDFYMEVRENLQKEELKAKLF